jgi:hypothetical protein
LDDHTGIEELGLAIGTTETRYVNGAINPFGGRRRTVGRWMAFAPTGFLGAELGVSAAERCRLPMCLTPGFIELLTEVAILGLQLGQAAFQMRNPALQSGDGAVTLRTAGAVGKYHDSPPRSVPRGGEDRGVLSWCNVMIGPESRTRLDRKSVRR